jgi:hypothetical protein
LRTRFVHHQCTTEKLLAVQRSDGLFGLAVIAKFGETESARLTREAIAKQNQRIRLDAQFRKQPLHLLLRGLERHISNIQFLHGRSPCASNKRAEPQEAEELNPGRGQSASAGYSRTNKRSGNLRASCA